MIVAARIPVNGTVLFVEDTAEPDLPVIFCLHSLFLDGRMFDELVEVARGKFRVVRPEYRGQGRSDLDTVDIIDVDTCAADMEAVLDHLGLRNVNLVVQSMGGDVGFRLVHHRPDLFKAMVVMGSSARSEPADQLADLRKWVDNAGENGSVGETLDMTMDIMFGKITQRDPAKVDMLALWRDRIAAVPKTLRPAMAGVIERGSCLPLLPDIKIPVVVFSGEEDLPRPLAWSDEMVEALPNAELVRLPRVGHSNILEAPEIVIPRTLEFLEAH